MKKRFYVFSMLAAGMLLAGCSDDLEGGQDGPNVVEGETGYVKIALNLPSAPASNFRAANNNDDFDDGIEAEYAVNDVILALFYGTDETSATLGCAYSLGGAWTDDVDNDNVTRYISSVQKIKAPAEGQKVYALAIVNGGTSGYFGVSGDKLQFKNTSSGTLADADNYKLASFYEAAHTMDVDLTKIANTNTSDDKKANFLMLNAPTSNKAAATGMNSDDTHSVTTLVEVPVWESEAAAESNPATDIYVERAVAKVTVSVDKNTQDDYSLTVDAPNTTYNGATVTFQGWKLQTTNKSMFAVRNVYAKDASTMMPSPSDASTYAWKTWAGFYVSTEICRFFGTAEKPYRVYWGVDPNYFSVVDKNNIATNFNVYDKDDLTTADEWNGMNNTSTTNWVAEYCAENTTIAKAMQDDNLTGVLLKAKFELDDSGVNSGINNDLFMINNTSAIYTDEEFIRIATNALNASQNTALADGSTLTLKTVLGGMTITVAENVSELLQISGGTSTELSPEQEKAILDACGGSIKYYKGGVMYYYTSLIQHFGDVPTKVDGTINALTDYSEKEHLGRYGVLRNNWYELNITSVGGPGEPEIPEVPSEPADGTEGYINATINILSWAKRQQNVDL